MNARHLVIVTGGRRHAYPDFVRHHLNAIYVELGGFLLFHGACRDKETGEMTGVDKYADEWGNSVHDVDVRPFEADWDRWGDRAGLIRNDDMVGTGARLYPLDRIHGLAFPQPGSRGTMNCAAIMRRYGITPKVWTYTDIRAWRSAL